MPLTQDQKYEIEKRLNADSPLWEYVVEDCTNCNSKGIRITGVHSFTCHFCGGRGWVVVQEEDEA
jgi:hypothetical protein